MTIQMEKIQIQAKKPMVVRKNLLNMRNKMAKQNLQGHQDVLENRWIIPKKNNIKKVLINIEFKREHVAFCILCENTFCIIPKRYFQK